MSIIIHEQQAGSFTLIGFYERRVRRILPVLLFMLICYIPFAVLWMNLVRLSYFAAALVSVIGFASNSLGLTQVTTLDSA